MKKFLALSMLTALVLIGCNKAAAPTTAPAVDADVVANAPKGCVSKNTIASKDAETVVYAAANSWYVETTPDNGTFYFANYTLDPQSPYGHTYAGKDTEAGFAVSTTNKDPVNVGTWDQKDPLHKLSGMEINVTGSGRSIIGDKNSVQITYFGTDFVCGTANIDDTYGSIKGDFIAKYYKWKSSL
ncbi:hypothetical protein HZA40_01100 [Candidatus Peregrinibacteria bacterium]|nr:hypothetical protein [Candidatus Peregrinibacteria bacterium]